MAYTPTTWKTGDMITAQKMNKLEQGVQNEQAGPAGPSYTLPAANPTTLGGVKQAAAVADAAAAPTKEEFNALLTSLRNAGILATGE